MCLNNRSWLLSFSFLSPTIWAFLWVAYVVSPRIRVLASLHQKYHKQVWHTDNKGLAARGRANKASIINYPGKRAKNRKPSQWQQSALFDNRAEATWGKHQKHELHNHHFSSLRLVHLRHKLPRKRGDEEKERWNSITKRNENAKCQTSWAAILKAAASTAAKAAATKTLLQRRLQSEEVSLITYWSYFNFGFGQCCWLTWSFHMFVLLLWL